MRKILKVLRDPDNDFMTRFVPDKKEGIVLGCCGVKDDGGFTICLNPIDIFLPTLLHECIHAAYPDLSETKVRLMTTETLIGLTRRQRKKIFVLWATRLSEEVIK
jgi:hypothetical protein